MQTELRETILSFHCRQ